MKTRDSKERKNAPVFSGFCEYFPDAMMMVAELSKIGNDKHNPDQPLHWSKGKSNDHGDCILRHQLEYNKIDEETGLLHAVSVAWRAMAQLQTLLEDTQDTEQVARSKYALGTTCYRNTPYEKQSN